MSWILNNEVQAIIKEFVIAKNSFLLILCKSYFLYECILYEHFAGIIKIMNTLQL